MFKSQRVSQNGYDELAFVISGSLISDLQFLIENIVLTMHQSAKCKILLLGQSAVGKTSLFKRFTSNSNQKITPTIGLEYKQKVVELKDGSSIKAQLWDTAGTERYRTITPICYRNVDGVLIVFDISDEQSFRNTQYWFDQLSDKAEDCTQVLLVGNKNDRELERQVTQAQAESKAKEQGVSYLETSSLSAKSTQLLFCTLIEKIVEKRSLEQSCELSRHNQFQSIRLTAVTKHKSMKEQECC